MMTSTKTPSFQVLNRAQNIHSHYLIEASAGTGKTYSIENIVVRLLIDQQRPCFLEQILIVTFTKAATSDLKTRIRNNILRTLNLLKNRSSEEMPDYLVCIYEKGDEALNYAEKQLEQALTTFEQASIFTIHGFCHRMLKEQLFEADVPVTLTDPNEISPALYHSLIKDFFRLQLDDTLVTAGQLRRALSCFGGQDKLENELYHLITRGIPIAETPKAQDLINRFLQAMRDLKTKTNVSSQQILNDFQQRAPFYNKIFNRQGHIKKETYVLIERFANLFEKNQWDVADFDQLIDDGVCYSEIFHSDNLNQKKKLSLDNLPVFPFLEDFTNTVATIICKARNSDFILCCLAYRCQKIIVAYLDQKELLNYDDLLKAMHKATRQKPFVEKIQNRFVAAIIDEFQDTDPLQWDIFKTLFLESEPSLPQYPAKHLYLVGDPKQSIYGFRQADIYTYLAAGNALGAENKSSLDVNYRSTQPLVEALNALFSPETAPNLITLPRLQLNFPYTSVKSGGQISEKLKNDGFGAIHFFAFEDSSAKSIKMEEAEESYFFPFIGLELQKLIANGFSPNNCAILVADRYQAARLATYLKTVNISVVGQHSAKLTETLTFAALKELLQAILWPQNEGILKLALGGPFLGWSQMQLVDLITPLQFEPLIAKMIYLRNLWHERGFITAYQAFLQSSWNKNGKSVVETLLNRKEGIHIYHQLEQMAELLYHEEQSRNLPPYHLLEMFDEWSIKGHENPQKLNERHDPTQEGVRILTIHSSKGLEFDIVFALGVIRNTRKPSSIIPIENESLTPMLSFVADENDPRYIQYLQEIDAEKLRQLYVAFTRAKYRLYIPVLHANNSKAKLGIASPMEIYLSLLKSSSEEESQKKSPIDSLLELTKTHSITYSSNPDALDRTTSLASTTATTLTPPSKPTIAGKQRYLYSFTGLSNKKELMVEPIQQTVSPPIDFENMEKTAHTLPTGSTTGTFLHSIFEQIPFHLARRDKNDEEFLHAIDRHIKGSSFEPWEQVIRDIIFTTLTAPLFAGSNAFRLCDLKEENSYREHEFIFACDNSSLLGVNAPSGYLKGVIDLIFMHDGKYFLVDWKSNWLGPNSSYYNEKAIEEAMSANNYDLQAKIYEEALKRYLKIFDSRDFQDIFGGTFYLFLRGIPNGGIFIANHS